MASGSATYSLLQASDKRQREKRRGCTLPSHQLQCYPGTPAPRPPYGSQHGVS